MKKLLKLLIAVVFFMSFLPLNENVYANSVRSATIVDLSGEVYIIKSNGKKALYAYKGMIVTAGDKIVTGDGSVVLSFSNGSEADDTISLLQHSTLLIYQLKNNNSTITKTKLTKGKAFVDVASIKNESDQFIFETNEKAFNIRGTNFFISVDENTANTIIGLFSGVVQYHSNSNASSSNEYIYPSQIVNASSNNSSVQQMSNATLEEMLKEATPEVVDAIVANLIKINEENKAKKQSSVSNDATNKDLIEENLDRVAFALLDELRKLNKITEDQYIQSFNKLNLNTTRNSNLSVGEAGFDFPTDPTSEMQKRQEQLRQQQQELADKLKKQQEELQKKNQEKREKSEEELSQNYLASLNNDEKDEFLKRQKELKELNKQRDANTPPPNTGGNPPNNGGGDGDGSSGSIPPGDSSDGNNPGGNNPGGNNPGGNNGDGDTNNPTNPNEYVWDGVELPFEILNDENERLSFIYNELTESYELETPIIVENFEQLIFKPLLFDDEVTVKKVTISNEPRDRALGEYYFDISNNTVKIIYRISHAHYGNRKYIIELTPAMEEPDSWETVQKPIVVQHPFNSSQHNVDYTFYALEDEEDLTGTIWLEPIIVDGITEISITALPGYEIVSTSHNQASINGDEYVFTLDPSIDMTEQEFDIQIQHEQFGLITVSVNVQFDKASPFEILYGVDGMNLTEYDSYRLGSNGQIRHIYEENEVLIFKAINSADSLAISYSVSGENQMDEIQLVPNEQGLLVLPLTEQILVQDYMHVTVEIGDNSYFVTIYFF